MKIVVVGTGFVGLPHAAVLAEQGHEVWACDIDPARIAAYQSGDAAQIERYVNEPGLAASVAENLGRHLFFSTDLGRAAAGDGPIVGAGGQAVAGHGHVGLPGHHVLGNGKCNAGQAAGAVQQQMPVATLRDGGVFGEGAFIDLA